MTTLYSYLVEGEMTFRDAIELCDVEMAKYVIHQNFDPLVKINGKTPAAWCVISGNFEILDVLFNKYDESCFDFSSLFYESAMILLDNEMVSTYEEFFNLFSELHNKEAVLFLTNMIRDIIESDSSD
jgi:hypothetical protein